MGWRGPGCVAGPGRGAGPHPQRGLHLLRGAGGQGRAVMELGLMALLAVGAGRSSQGFAEGLSDGGGVCAGENMWWQGKKSSADFWGGSDEVFSSAGVPREG